MAVELLGRRLGRMHRSFGKAGVLALMWFWFAVSAAWAASEIVVKAGEHPGFGRLVFNFEDKVAVRTSRAGNRVHLQFDTAAAIGSPGKLPHNISNFTGGQGEADIVVKPGSVLRPSRMGNLLVLDVLDQSPPRSPESEPPSAEPKAEPASEAAQPVPSRAREEPPPREAARPEPAPAHRDAPPETPASPGGIALAARKLPASGTASEAAIAIPFESGVGAAAFRYGDSLLLVFDVRRPIDLAGLRDDPFFGKATLSLLPEATLIRVPLAAAGPGFALHRTPEAWVVASSPNPPGVRPITMDMGEGRLLFAAEHPGRTVVLAEPDSGSMLLVGTQSTEGQGVQAGRQTPGFNVLPSIQGVAIEALSDSLSLHAGPAGFVLSGGPEGLGIGVSPAESVGRAAALSRRFDFPASSTDALRERLHARMLECATAPALARGRKRRAAAESMIALGLGAEAQSLLQLAAAGDPREAGDPDNSGLAAIAALLAGRVGESDGISDPRLDGTDEIAFWRAARDAMRNESLPEAADTFAASTPLLLAYPETLQARLLPLAAETLIAGKKLKAASVLLDRFPSESTLALARSMLAEAKGDTDAALAGYDALASSGDRLLRSRAIERATELRLSAGRASPADTAQILEKSMFAWRGDARELNLRLRAAELRAQSGAWREALDLLRETASVFPEEQPTIQGRVRELVAKMLQPENADRVAPLNFISVVENNADLLPQGLQTPDIAGRLADKLLALDLPKRAGGLLEKIMRATPEGPVRANLGARLGALRLREGDAAGARAALAASQAGGLDPSLAENRTLTEAYAIAKAGDVSGAITALAGLESAAAADARAKIQENAKAWPEAEAALRELVAKTVPEEGPLDAGQRATVLRLASAAAQAGDAAQLAALRERQAARMGDGKEADLFRLLTAPPIQDTADLPRAGQEAALARKVAGSVSGAR
ncbi:MAG: hypothetical protein JO110_29935 [Acetobacteraceae bacterium]|nr:hypothetical protein [Acetobacteraceae bacterium]